MLRYGRIETADRVYRAGRREKSGYEKVRRAEIQYSANLRKIARAVGQIVEMFPAGDPSGVGPMTRLLEQYAIAIQPWAARTADAMLADVTYRDTKNWNDLTKNMGEALRKEMLGADIGDVLRRLQAEQVALITSIPLDAAKRVHELTAEGMINATRAREIANDISRTTHVTESRATLIARTEVGRVSTNLGMARATYVGSEGYIWRTARDGDVRSSHKKLEGKYFRWDSPPVTDPPNHRAHPGCIWNCRCYPEIVLPETIH